MPYAPSGFAAVTLQPLSWAHSGSRQENWLDDQPNEPSRRQRRRRLRSGDGLGGGHSRGLGVRDPRRGGLLRGLFPGGLPVCVGEFGRGVADLVGLHGLAHRALLEGPQRKRLTGDGQERAGVRFMGAARGGPRRSGRPRGGRRCGGDGDRPCRDEDDGPGSPGMNTA
jgi:hypothetical protein